MDKNKYKIRIFYIVGLAAIFVYIVAFLTDVSNLNKINPIANIINFLNFSTIQLIYIIGFAFALSTIIVLGFSYKTVHNNQSKVIEDGDYGNAKWSSEKEINKEYLLLKRVNDKGSGWYLGEYQNKIVIEQEDRNMLVIAPPGKGKTSRFIYNNIIHIFANSETVINSDTKDEVHRTMYPYALEYGYKCINFNYRSPFNAHKDNLLSPINKYIDLALMSDNENDKVKHKAKAQRYAKILANAIIETADAGANQYFYDVARGIIVSTILLVSEYCDEKDRHIINVLRIVAEGMEALDCDDDISRTKLYGLMKYLDDSDKAKWFAESAVKGEIKATLSSFSTALSKLLAFVDDEIEQMICFESEFDVEELLNNHKYFISINIPEENPTRHFFASLKLNTLNNMLLDMANQDGRTKLPFIVRKIYDEFGTMPAIENLANNLTADRSRGIYAMLIIQNYSQLALKYKEDASKIIRQACQNIIFTGLSPEQYEDADYLSKALGNQTVVALSTNKTNNNFKIVNGGNISEQQQSRPLMFADQILKLPMDNWIVIPSGRNPVKLKTTLYLNNYNLKSDIKYIDPVFVYQKVSLISIDSLERVLRCLSDELDKNNINVPKSEETLKFGLLEEIMTMYGLEHLIKEKNKKEIIENINNFYNNRILNEDEIKIIREELKNI